MQMGGILIVKVVLFFGFGHQGASLFSKPNVKMAVSGIIGVKMGLNLVGLVPCHSRRYPGTHLDFWPPGGCVDFVSKTLKWPLCEL